MKTFSLNTCAACGAVIFEEEVYCLDCLNDMLVETYYEEDNEEFVDISDKKNFERK